MKHWDMFLLGQYTVWLKTGSTLYCIVVVVIVLYIMDVAISIVHHIFVGHLT